MGMIRAGARATMETIKTLPGGTRYRLISELALMHWHMTDVNICKKHTREQSLFKNAHSPTFSKPKNCTNSYSIFEKKNISCIGMPTLYNN